MKYSIGIDYGTQSARAELLNITTGEVVSVVETFYPHGIMIDQLPTGEKLNPDWAIQDGNDYYHMAVESIRKLIDISGIDVEKIIGLGIDTTACTMIPLDKDLEPLSNNPLYCRRPHAYVKLWKHHAAQKYADMLNEIAILRNEKFLSRYGGKISSEWTVPKVMQIAYEDPELYEATFQFCDIADWLNYKFTGVLVKNNVMTGYKTMYLENGYPSDDFFEALHPAMKNFVKEKLTHKILSIGERVGYITEQFSKDSGLSTKVAVAVPHTDAGVVPIALGMNKPGQMVMSIGTSTCHFLLGDLLKEVPGICGSIINGAVPGFYSYEAGQAAVGDSFSWFINNCVGTELKQNAYEQNISIYKYLADKINNKSVGSTGLLAIDWFNGNRSTLVNTDLSGVILGLKLDSKPEDIYKAILESTAFGTRKIIDNFVQHGIPVNELYACGGIPRKDSLLMQMYADICKCKIYVYREPLVAAYGSAVLGAVAAGNAVGGYDSVDEAEAKLALDDFIVYEPIEKNVLEYDKLYSIYDQLYGLLGKKDSLLMKLAQIKKEASR